MEPSDSLLTHTIHSYCEGNEGKERAPITLPALPDDVDVASSAHLKVSSLKGSLGLFGK